MIHPHPHPLWRLFGHEHHAHHPPHADHVHDHDDHDEHDLHRWRGRRCASRRHGRGGGHGHGHGGPPLGGPFGGGPPFGGGFPPFPGFPFFRRGARARRGDVRAAILVLLADAPRNGYQLMQEIEQRSQGAWRPSPGSMYPALQQLEDEGLVRIESGAGGRTFHLTDEGKKAARAQAREPAPWDAAGGDDHESAMEFRMLLRQVALAAMQVAQAGTAAQVASAQKILEGTRRALYRILAEEGTDATEDADDGGDT